MNLSIDSKIIFTNNYLEENLIGQTGTVTNIYNEDTLQVRLDNSGRFVLAKIQEVKLA